MRKLTTGFAALAVILFTAQAYAVPLTTQFNDVGTVTIDLSVFTGGSIPVATTPSVTVLTTSTAETVDLSRSITSSATIGDDEQLLGINVSWDGVPFVSLVDTGSTESVTFDFSSPVRKFGGLTSYAPNGGGDDFTMFALDSGGSVIGALTFNIQNDSPINTGGGSTNDGEFRGIDAGSNLIYSIRLSGNVGVIRDARFFRSSGGVPEPSTLVMLSSLIGIFFGMHFYRRKRKAA